MLLIALTAMWQQQCLQSCDQGHLRSIRRTWMLCVRLVTTRTPSPYGTRPRKSKCCVIVRWLWPRASCRSARISSDAEPTDMVIFASELRTGRALCVGYIHRG